MTGCDLERLYRDTVETLILPASVEQKQICFSTSVLPVPDEMMLTDRLICKRGFHGYGGSLRVDLVQLYASTRTFQLLGLWILSMVFHEQPVRSGLVLSHESTDIKTIVCDYKHGGTYWGSGVQGYTSAPVQYRHFCSPPQRHPWASSDVPLHDLPNALLTNESEMVVTEEQFQLRDTLVGFGNDRGAIRFAALLLDVGGECDEQIDIDLEGELGFRGVAPGSTEIQLVTPGTERWIAIGSEYPEFG